MNQSCNLLNKIYHNAKTGAETINVLLLKMRSEDFKILLLAQKEKYLKIANEAAELLAGYRTLPTDVGFAAKIGLWTAMEMNTSGRADRAAETIIDACTSGIIEIAKLLNSGNFDVKTKDLAERLVDTEQKSMYFAQSFL